MWGKEGASFFEKRLVVEKKRPYFDGGFSFTLAYRLAL